MQIVILYISIYYISLINEELKDKAILKKRYKCIKEKYGILTVQEGNWSYYTTVPILKL
jgi:hypothetical protein